MADMKLTKNFRLSEFVCGCGCCKDRADIPMNPGFMAKLQKMRDIIGHGLTITSGYRCEVHNAKVGGSISSLHMEGLAADIAVASSKERFDIVEAATVVGMSGIGVSKSFIHVDCRDDGPMLFLY